MPRQSFLVPIRRRAVFRRLIALLMLGGLINMSAQAAMASVRDIRALSAQAGLQGTFHPHTSILSADTHTGSPSGDTRHGDDCPCHCALPCALLQHTSALPSMAAPLPPQLDPPSDVPERAEAPLVSASIEPALRPPIA